MPTLPQYQVEVAPQPSRRIVQRERTPIDDGLAAGLHSVGKAIDEVEGRITQARDNRELATADRITRERLDKLKFSLEHEQTDIPDAEIKTRWQAESDKIIGENAAILSNRNARDVWTQRAKGWQADGALWSEGLGYKRGVDRVRGAHVAAAAELEKQAGDLSVSRETFVTSIENEKALIRQNAKLGILDHETMARQTAALDTVLEKDRFSRTRAEVERLVTVGANDEAKKLIDDFGGDVEQGRALRQAREGAEQDVRAAANRAEKEKRDAEILASNTFEMGLLKGEAGHSYRDLDRMVETGVISLNDAPQLRRSIRAEHDRAETEAKQAKMSSEMKQMLADRSADYRLGFDAFSASNPALFQGGYDSWNDQYKAFYDRMTPDDQRAIDRKLIEMTQQGQTASAAKTVYGTMLDEAKRVIPDWKIGSDAKGAPKEGVEFAGKLYAAAERIANENGGGKDLTVQQVRDAVARALDAYQPGKWDNLPTNIYDNEAGKVNARLQAGVDPNYDYQAEQQIRDAYYEKFGRSIPDDELKRYYAAAKAGK